MTLCDLNHLSPSPRGQKRGNILEPGQVEGQEVSMGPCGQGRPGAGAFCESLQPHLPGPGRGEEASGRMCGPLLGAGIAQPVRQPLAEHIGLVYGRAGTRLWEPS